MELTGNFILPQGMHQFTEKQLKEISKKLSENAVKQGKTQADIDKEVMMTLAENK